MTHKDVRMELKRDPRCYTDVCIDGKWYHYDHCSTHVYMLMGGAAPRDRKSVV